jgi:NDP-sugar pyrophosphorylase family protein
MIRPTLLVLAAGLGSRYGSLKQIESIGPRGETIIDYSVYDAIRAGFAKVVFVIKQEIEADFKEHLLKRFEKRIETGYVFQDLDMLPEDYSLPSEREKPWGTAHAIMIAENSVHEPFAAINADDFYGLEAFTEMHKFLSQEAGETDYSMIGYKLKNTLSEHGTVSRGVCDIDENDFLISVSELTRIQKENNRIVYLENDESRSLAENSIVSMNMWGFTTSVFGHIKKRFSSFLDQNINDPRAEYFIPVLVDQLIKAGEARVKVLHCDASWFGITYREDRDAARKSILRKIDRGIYPPELWV